MARPRDTGGRPRVARGLGAMMVALCCAGALGLGAPGAAVAQETLDRILAVASGEVITLSDVRASLELGRIDVGRTADPVRAALTQLIDRALVLDEVERFAPPEPSAQDVDRAFDSVAKRFGSADAFELVLVRNGVDRQYVRELLRDDLRIRAYLDQRFTAESVDAQRRLVEAWVGGLRQRAQVIDQYALPDASAPAGSTAAPGRD